MSTLIKNDEELRRFVPNITKAVAGETPWTERLHTFLATAERWLFGRICPLRLIPEELMETARAAVATRAFAAGIDAVNLVVTPNGIAVASNQNLAPASKDRTASARAAMETESDRLVCGMLRELRTREDWRTHPVAARFFNLFPDPEEFAEATGHDGPVMKHYFSSLATINAETATITRHWLGHELTFYWTTLAFSGDLGEEAPAVDMLRAVVADAMKEERHGADDPRIRTLIEMILARPESQAFRLWEESVQGEAFKFQGYENKKESGGYFF